MAELLQTASNRLTPVDGDGAIDTVLQLDNVPSTFEVIDIAPRDAALRTEHRLRWAGVSLIAATFGGLGLWAALAPLSSAAMGPGVIALENYRKTVQHLEGGLVKSIEVRDGDTVRKDQILVTLDDTQARAQQEVLRGQWMMALAKEARLVAERDRRASVTPAPELEALRSDPRAQDAQRIQGQAFAARRAALLGESTLFERQIGQLQAKAKGLTVQRSSRDNLAGSFQKELDDYQVLLAQGYVDKQRVRELERNVAQTDGQRGALVSEQAATELQVSETRVKMLQIQNEFQREVARELSQVQTDLFDLRSKLKSLDDLVARTVIRAPDHGTVLDLTVHTLGAVVRPGAKVLDLVPQNEKLIVEAQLSPGDIDQVRIGQIAEVRFSGLKQRDLGKIEGRLTAISADRLVDENSREKEPYYLARVEISADGQRELARAKLALLPGMPAEVLVNTGDHTMLSYLLEPLRNTLARGLRED